MNEKQTFQMCLKQGMGAHAEMIAEISELASKEYVIEQSLDKMLSEWGNKILELTPYKQTGMLFLYCYFYWALIIIDHVSLIKKQYVEQHLIESKQIH